MVAWAALLIVTAIYLRAIDPLPPDAHGFERFSKGIGMIALVAGIAYRVGALSGGRDVLQPLAGPARGRGRRQAAGDAVPAGRQRRRAGGAHRARRASP